MELNRMANNVNDTPEEKDFRARYALELRKKKTQISDIPDFGLDEISEELARVKHQAMITPGRRGEQIKFEEINREILRRISIGHPVTQTSKLNRDV